jgi:hypothetical protein
VSVLIARAVLCFFASLRHECIIFITSLGILCSESKSSEPACSECSDSMHSKFRCSEPKHSKIKSSDVNSACAVSIAGSCNGRDGASELHVRSGFVASVSSAVILMDFVQKCQLHVLTLLKQVSHLKFFCQCVHIFVYLHSICVINRV